MAGTHEHPSDHSPALSRRNVLILGGVAILAGALPALYPILEPDRGGLTTALMNLLADPKGAAKLGQEWRAHGAAPRQTDAIAASIGKRLAPLGWQLDGKPEDLRQALAARINQDFIENDMIAIGGWLLARTAADLCALAASLEGSDTTNENAPAAHDAG
jgi:hypothetical protein